MKCLALVLVIALAAVPASSEDEPALPVTVIDEEIIQITTRLPLALESTGATVDVVSAEAIRNRQVSAAAEAVRSVPGVFPRGGAPGSATSIFLRGAASNQTIVLLDGVQINDPTIGGQANFFDLGVGNLDRIEVLRGAASSLYGSEGAGGVVNLVSRTGAGEPRFRLYGEGGSFGHYLARLSGLGSLGELEFSGGLGRSRFHNELANQEYLVDDYSLALGGEPCESLHVTGRFRYTDAEAEDPWDYPFGAQIEKDPSIERTRNTTLWALSIEHDLSDLLEWSLSGSLYHANSLFLNGPDAPGDPVELRSRAEADVRNLTLQTRWDPPEIVRGTELRFLLGAEYEDEISESRVSAAYGPSPDLERTVRNRALFLVGEADVLERVLASIGVRADRNSFFGWEVSFSGSLLVRVPETDTRIRANCGEAFRAPKPVEFDDPYVGNPDLEPEKSLHFDVGFEQELLGGRARCRLTWFQVGTRDLIAYDSSSLLLENLDRTRSRGVEFQAEAEPLDGLFVSGWLTRQEARDLDPAPGRRRQLVGRPKWFGGGEIRYEGEGFRVAVVVHASDDFPGTGKITPDGTHRSHPGRKLLVSILGGVEILDDVWLTARVENLLDREWYDDESSPDGLGRGFFAGLAWDFP